MGHVNPLLDNLTLLSQRNCIIFEFEEDLVKELSMSLVAYFSINRTRVLVSQRSRLGPGGSFRESKMVT